MPKHIKLPGYAYFLTTRLCGRLSVFEDEQCCFLLLKDLDFYRKELDYQIYGYVVMPDHFHWIIHIIRNGKDFEEKANYIHKNPVRAKLVDNLKEYKFSSYINYYLGDESLIKIDLPMYSILAK